jgi:hypothetical protein
VKTLDMVSPADPIDTTSSVAVTTCSAASVALQLLSQRFARLQMVDLVVHGGECRWLRVRMEAQGLWGVMEGGQGVGAARRPEGPRTRPLDGLE